MYSPKIKEDLIAKLYQKAKVGGVPMTKLVDQILRSALNGKKNTKGKGNEVKKRVG